jgi:hypothetical protein
MIALFIWATDVPRPQWAGDCHGGEMGSLNLPLIGLLIVARSD